MIKDIKEVNFPEYATLSQATVNIADMGERTITTQIKIDGDVVPDFSYDWEIEYKGERYVHTARTPQASKDNTSRRTSIDLTFKHWAIAELQRYYFVEMASTEAGTVMPNKYEAPLGLSLPDFVNAFNKVLDYYFNGDIRIVLNPAWVASTERSFVEINYSHLWDVLQKVYEIYGVRWTLEPVTDESRKYLIKFGYDAPEASHTFEYGYQGGLLKVERQVQSTDIKNIILGRGGEKNLPNLYFKDYAKYGSSANSNNGNFSPDPDAIPELKDIAFTELRSAEFRSYVQGWAAKHYHGNVTREQSYVSWAWDKGYNDTKFNPVEYVKDDDSIAKYGEQWGALENNDEIYPSIQGSGVDEVVAVEEMTNDYMTDEDAENDSQTANLIGGNIYCGTIYAHGKFTMNKKNIASFTVPVGKNANVLKVGIIELTTHRKVKNSLVKWVYTGEKYSYDEFEGQLVSSDEYVIHDEDGIEYSASGLGAGVYYIDWVIHVESDYSDDLYQCTASIAGFKLITATVKEKKVPTFDIWVKNLWNTTRGANETPEQYAQRVWVPILGADGSEAQVTFTTGLLSVSSDYQFTIVGIPELDESKSYNEEKSHWRITLGRSQAEYESTGKLIPNTQINAVAGDKFFFTGIELPHQYVVWAENRLHDYKEDNLITTASIQPTWVVSVDKVRANNLESGEVIKLIKQLEVGTKIRIADKRLISGAPLELYVQSATYTWAEPSKDKPYIYPDVEIVLSDKVATVSNPVEEIKGEISILQQQVGSLSNIQQIVRGVCDRLYLRKDGIEDVSLSPTKFANLITGSKFRQGSIGGADWGFYRDANGRAVLEVDRAIIRDELLVNSLIINQASYVGGMQIISAASVECSSVEETETGYKCYFDRKQGAVANLFRVDDVAMCQQWDGDTTTKKFYKRRVTECGDDYIVLSKTDVYGSGIPSERDTIIQYGNYTDKDRQYVIIRDVIGGGYERMLEGLDSVTSNGKQYYYAGRQSDSNLLWFVGDEDNNQFAKFENGKLIISGQLTVNSQFQNADGTYSPLQEYLDSFVISSENINQYVDSIVNGYTDELQKQIDGAIETWFYAGVPTLSNAPANQWTTTEQRNVHLGDLYYDQNTGKCYRFMMDGNSYVWKEITDTDIQAAMDAANKAQDTADNKRRVFFSQPVPPYDAGDLWVNATYETQYKNDILRCSTSRASGAFAIGDWQLASKYTDDTVANEAKNEIAVYSYLKAALGENTTVTGGLVLTSLIQLGKTVGSTFTIYSGINGVIDTTKKGNGIAAWYGGNMVDHEADPSLSNWAKSLYRFDGSGYIASGSISWNVDGSGFVGKDKNGDPVISWDSTGVKLSNEIKLGTSSETLNSILAFMLKFNNMFEIESLSDGRKVIKAKLDGLYTNGFLSALGLNDDIGTGGGASALSELTDVSLATLSADNVLMYDGTHWVNRPMSSIRPDLTGYATQSWVTSQGYLTSSSSLNYAATSGCLNAIDQRDSDNLPVSVSSERAIKGIFSNQTMPDANWWSGFVVKGWSSLEYITWELVGPAGTINSTESLKYRTSDVPNNSWNAWRTILDSSNYTTTLDQRYVTLSTTQTITGAKTFGARIIANSGIKGTFGGASTATDWTNCGVFAGADIYPLVLYFAGGTENKRRYYFGKGGDNFNINSANDSNRHVATALSIFHNGDVRASHKLTVEGQIVSTVATGTAPFSVVSSTKVTNLNADLLDGLQWSNFNLERLYTIDAKSLSTDKFYPILFSPQSMQTVVEIGSTSGGSSLPYNFNGLHAIINCGGWSDRGNYILVLDRFNYTNNEITIGSIGLGTTDLWSAIWVRGGLTYSIRSNVEPQLKSTDYTTPNGEKFTVGSNLDGGSANDKVILYWKNTDAERDKNKVATIDGNVASATKLQTARTLWGQSFDGSANVSGDMTGVGNITASGTIKSSAIPAFYADVATNAWAFMRIRSGTVGFWDIAVRDDDLSNSLQFRYKGIDANRVYITTGGQLTVSSTTAPSSSSTTAAITTSGGLYVAKTIRADLGIWSKGYVSALGQNTSSDMRLKNKLRDITIPVTAIANAPAFLFSWKNKDTKDVGSSAQYWLNVLPDAVKQRGGYYEMGYGNIALVSCISLAKFAINHEDRIKELEKENKRLKEKIKKMERRMI